MALPNDLSWLANLPGQSVANNPNASGNTGQTLSGRTAAASTDPELQQQLTQLQKYDPNASIVQTGENGFYDVSYDQSKLPAMPKAADGQLWARNPADFATN